MQKTFLKWAGNKQRIVERIKRVLPAGFRLIEPFVGSGAVFLNTNYDHYHLADSNGDLITLYRILQHEGQPFIDYCRTFFRPETNDPDVYYANRTRFNTTADSRLKSALFLYLNRHGYNGLCRYNSKGGFNVPFGRYKKPYFPEVEMYAFHQQAQRAEFHQADFTTTMSLAQPGDVVYCDPPYVPLSDTAKFTSYSTNKFGQAEQEKLALSAQKLAQRGIPVVISNHDTPFTRQAYNGAIIKAFDVRRFISCDGANRNKASELLAIFT